MEYLEEISWELEKLNLPAGDTEEVQRLIVGAFKDGLARRKPTNQLEGYSNLTAAISAGEPIDWEKLDGLNVKCVNPELGGELHGTLKRDSEIAAEHCGAWWNGRMDECYTTALWSGWNDKHGWTLYIEGDIPLVRKTADQLDYYTYFYGHTPGEKPVMAYVGGSREPWSGRRVHYAPCMATSLTRASNWVVLEEYGTSPKPEGK